MKQPSLFDEQEGLLFPGDTLEYFPDFLEAHASWKLLDLLQTTVPWRQHTATFYGKSVPTPRLTAWYGEPGRTYRFSGYALHPLPWTEALRDLSRQLEGYTDSRFNTVLLNYYRDGKDSVAWHTDSEPELGERPVIASVSLGQERKFEFRKKDNHSQRYSLVLGNGSLLIMKGALQRDWEHRIPKSSQIMIPRINLTFRQIS